MYFYIVIILICIIFIFPVINYDYNFKLFKKYLPIVNPKNINFRSGDIICSKWHYSLINYPENSEYNWKFIYELKNAFYFYALNSVNSHVDTIIKYKNTPYVIIPYNDSGIKRKCDYSNIIDEHDFVAYSGDNLYNIIKNKKSIHIYFPYIGDEIPDHKSKLLLDQLKYYKFNFSSYIFNQKNTFMCSSMTAHILKTFNIYDRYNINKSLPDDLFNFAIESEKYGPPVILENDYIYDRKFIYKN